MGKSVAEIKQQLRARIVVMQRQIVQLEESLHHNTKGATQAEGAMCLDVIGVLDALEDQVKRQAEAGQDTKSLERVCRKVQRVLESCGVAPITFPGKKAQIGLAKIVETQDSNDVPEGTILSEVRKGYTRAGQVLRPAEVITAGRGVASDPSFPPRSAPCR